MTRKHLDELTALERCLGAIDEHELSGTRPDIADEITNAEQLLAGLAHLATPVEPPEELLDSIETEIDALSLDGSRTMRADEGEWQIRSDKVWKKFLHNDPDSGSSIYLLRCEPGAIVLPHRHKRDEHVFVLEGEFRTEETIVKAGDSQFSPAGSVHGIITSPTGCLALVHC